MSTALSPSSETEPSVATELVVMRSRTSLFTSKVTSTCSPASVDVGHRADLDPGDPDRRPGLQAGDVGERVFRE